MIRLVVTALCMGLTVGPGDSQQATAIAEPSVVFVTAGQCVDSGTDGILDQAVAGLAAVGRVRDQKLARQQLAEHAVVEGARTGSPVERQVQVTVGRDVAPATVVTVAADADVAVLRVPRGGLPALEVATRDLPAGASVFAFGRAAGDAAPTSADTRVTGPGTPFVDIGTPTMRGGPVVDTRGRLVGLAVQDVTVMGAAGLTRLLRDKHIGLGPVDRDYRAGLGAYFA